MTNSVNPVLRQSDLGLNCLLMTIYPNILVYMAAVKLSIWTIFTEISAITLLLFQYKYFLSFTEVFGHKNEF